MKKHIIFLLFIFNITMLYANKSIKIDVKAMCSDSKIEEFMIKISSDKLALSKDAVQDNIDGYVDISEDSYYLKNNDDIYNLDGIVENLNRNNINQFSSYIDNASETFINIKELDTLKNTKDLKFVQKINLAKNNKTKSITTNTLDVYFDTNALNKEYQRCEEQINKSKQNLYFQYTLLIFFILLTLYLLKRNFKKH